MPHRGLLVGSRFRPPAKIILDHLSSNTLVRLEAEPDNPYDEHAIRVYVSVRELPESEYEALREELPSAGSDLAELLILDEDIWLGYLAASDGKPLAKAQMFEADLVGNRELKGATSGRLVFGASGEAIVEVEERDED